MLVSGLAIVITAATIALLLKLKSWLPLDRPNHRSMHSIPTPRTGGVAIFCGLVASMLFAREYWVPALLVPTIALTGIFFVDDMKGLPVKVRFTAQILAAVVLLFVHSGFHLGIVQFVLCVLTIAWMTNVYNFMDGSDGLAAGMTVIGFGAYSIAALDADAMGLAILSASIAGSGLGFLIFNFHPAKIFMGDAGSIPLGYLAGGIGIIGWIDGVWPLGFPAVVFSPFLVDATVTLAVRLLGKKPAWQAHRDHFYQKAILLGIGHRETALAEYAVMLICGYGGLLLLQSPELQPEMIAAWIAGYAILLGTIQIAWRKRTASI